MSYISTDLKDAATASVPNGLYHLLCISHRKLNTPLLTATVLLRKSMGHPSLMGEAFAQTSQEVCAQAQMRRDFSIPQLRQHVVDKCVFACQTDSTQKGRSPSKVMKLMLRDKCGRLRFLGYPLIMG